MPEKRIRELQDGRKETTQSGFCATTWHREVGDGSHEVRKQDGQNETLQ